MKNLKQKKHVVSHAKLVQNYQNYSHMIFHSHFFTINFQNLKKISLKHFATKNIVYSNMQTPSIKYVKKSY